MFKWTKREYMLVDITISIDLYYIVSYYNTMQWSLNIIDYTATQ